MHLLPRPLCKHRRGSTASTVDVLDDTLQKAQLQPQVPGGGDLDTSLPHRATTSGSRTGNHRRHRVHFANQEPQHVYCYPGATFQEHDLVWFNPRELASFQLDALAKATRFASQQQRQQVLQDPNKDSNNQNASWAESVLRVYRACRGGCSKQEFMMILAAATKSCNHLNETLGIHDLAIPVINRDYMVRRRYLMAQMHRIQSIPTQQLPDAKRTQLLSEASCQTSRCARSFAVYLAFVNAEDVLAAAAAELEASGR